MNRTIATSVTRLERIVRILGNIDPKNERNFRQTVRVSAAHLGNDTVRDEFHIGTDTLEVWKFGKSGESPPSEARSAIIYRLRDLTAGKAIRMGFDP